jgi:hypothetical protein
MAQVSVEERGQIHPFDGDGDGTCAVDRAEVRGDRLRRQSDGRRQNWCSASGLAPTLTAASSSRTNREHHRPAIVAYRHRHGLLPVEADRDDDTLPM